MSPFHSSTERNIDIVFCIDCSVGMADHLATVREKVKTFYPEFIVRLIEQGDSVQSCRCKIIGFRNYEMDGQEAMFQSQWFDVSDGHDEELDACLNDLQARGGGVDRNSGIEALFYAMTTDWNTRDSKDRQIIILFSNTDAVPLGTCKDQLHYPAFLVDLGDLLRTWMCHSSLDKDRFRLNERAKRLVMIAPTGSIYEYDLQIYMNRSLFRHLEDDAGFGAIDWKDIF